ncbi:hypothetical protein HG530_003195 [Fusarium avenaceum]|nr:hypothetical protein HG530_003195 [Fusarium avenaceum]
MRSFAIDDHSLCAILILYLRLWLNKLKASNLVFVSSELELSDFRNKIPNDDIRVLGTTGKSDTRLIKYKLGDCRLVAVEVENDGGDLAVP